MLIYQALHIFFFLGKLLFMFGISCHVPLFMSLGMVSEIPKEGTQECLMTVMFQHLSGLVRRQFGFVFFL